jgi:hypothetical protein
MDPGTIPSCAQQLEVSVLIFYQFDPVLGDVDGLLQGDPCPWLCALFGGGCCEIAFTSAASLSIHSTLSVISYALGIEHYALMDGLPGSILTYITLVPSKCALYSGSIVLLSPDY